uniref:Parathyroid hormone n=1 Tax=Oncorhynchus mykiss TaxID=8022 RepID=A0A8C7UHJ0_ONCMY
VKQVHRRLLRRVLNFSVGCNGYSLTNRKRSISEVQLMHNVGVHKQVGERQDWLQLKLKDIIAASHAKAQQHGQSGKIRSLLPDDLTGLGLYTS